MISTIYCTVHTVLALENPICNLRLASDQSIALPLAFASIAALFSLTGSFLHSLDLKSITAPFARRPPAFALARLSSLSLLAHSAFLRCLHFTRQYIYKSKSYTSLVQL